MVKVVPVLRAFDRMKALEFYVDWLGFELKWEHRPEGLPFYMQLSFRGALIDLSEHHGDGSPGANISLTGVGELSTYHSLITGKKYKFMNPGLSRPEWAPDSLIMTVIDPFYNHIHFIDQLI